MWYECYTTLSHFIKKFALELFEDEWEVIVLSKKKMVSFVQETIFIRFGVYLKFQMFLNQDMYLQHIYLVENLDQ